MKTSKKNPLVFLDVSIDGDPAERMVFELFSDVAPKTAENFRALCTGEKGISSKTGRPLHYKGSFFHRIINGLLVQDGGLMVTTAFLVTLFFKGGDFLKRDGSFGESIYGEKFPDDPPSKLKHDQRGLLSMALADRDARGSLFIITFKANHQLDRKYVVFGKIVEGHDVLDKIENVGDEDGRPSVTLKIINCGELHREKMNVDKVKIGKDPSSEANSREVHRRRKHKKSLKGRKKRRKVYYTSTSESDTSSDTEVESESESESDSDSDSDTSSSSDFNSSSDYRRKKRKRSSRRDRYRRGKRRDKRRGKKRRRHDKRSKRRSERASDSLTDTESESRSSSDDGNADVKGPDRKHKTKAQLSVGNQSPLNVEGPSIPCKNGEKTDMFEREEGELSKENGKRRSNGVDLQTNLVDDSPGKPRSHSISAERSRSSSPMENLSKRQCLSPRKSLSRSPCVNKCPIQVSRSSRSISRSPVKRSASGSPVRGKKGRSISRSPTNSPPRRNLTRTPPRTSSRKSSRTVSRSPVRSSRRSVSRSSGRAPSRRSASRSPVRAPTRDSRRSYSKSPVSDRGRNLSRSPSPDESPKRIRRGRGFSERYSYARRYRSPLPDRSPVRSYRYGSRIDRDRRSPRRYRSPPRARTPPRYRSRRSRTRSPLSRSPIRYRDRRRYTRSPICKRSPVKTSRVDDSPRAERWRSPSRRSSTSRSSLDSESPKKASKDRSRSSSRSPQAEKKGLVSYADGSPGSSDR